MAYDVIVIGAGLSGLTGGLRLAEAGQGVLLLAKGHGATRWANGAIGGARGAASQLHPDPEGGSARTPRAAQ